MDRPSSTGLFLEISLASSQKDIHKSTDESLEISGSKGSLKEIEGFFHEWIVEDQDKFIEEIANQVLNED